MPKAKFEDLVAQLRDQGDDDLADQFEQYSASTLRQKADRTGELEKELEDLRKENQSLKSSPKRLEALRKAGVNVEELRPADREAIERAELDGDPDEAWAAEFAERYQLSITPPGEGEEGGEKPPAAAVVTAATKAGGGAGSVPVVTPDTFADWDAPKQIRFHDEHPEEFDKLLQGETVRIAFQ